MRVVSPLGYQGSDFIERGEEVIVCPDPKCRYKHVDEYGDTNISSDVCAKRTKYAYFKCYKCRTVLFASPTDSHDDPVPFWLIKKMKVRKARFV
jgi:hypothetical protein